MADVIVIGGGHNGLVAAATLARAGRRVVVLEAADRVGGVAALVHDSDTLAPEVVSSLELISHGLQLQEPPPIFAPQMQGDGLLVHRDPASATELAEDSGAYLAWRGFINRILPIARGQLTGEAADIRVTAKPWPLLKTAVAVRRLGKHDMMELLRIGPSCVDDWLTEHFDSPLLRAVLAGPALHGTWMGPRSPTSTATLLLHEALTGPEVVGGPGELTSALKAAATAAGVEIQTGAEVASIRIEADRVAGVELVDGTAVDAPVVLSAIGPRRTLLELVPPWALDVRTAEAARVIRLRGSVAKLTLELSAPLELSCRAGVFERIHVGEHPLDLERGFDHVKHRRMPTAPPLDIRQRTTGGGASASILVRSAPFEIDGGWDDARRSVLQEEVLTSLERYAPRVREQVVRAEMLSPADIADRFRLEGGHEMHGEMGLDQLGPMRPSLALSHHRTPIPGLFLGSAGVHPGGAITGLPGLLAARTVLAG